MESNLTGAAFLVAYGIQLVWQLKEAISLRFREMVSMVALFSISLLSRD